MAQSARLGDINLGEINLGGGIATSSPDYEVTLTDSYTLSDSIEVDASYRYNLILEDYFLLADVDPDTESYGFYGIELSDLIVLAESISLLEIPNLVISLTDTVSLLDAIHAFVIPQSTSSLSDSFEFTDAISVALAVATEYTQNFSDSISLTDFIEIFSLQSSQLSLSDRLIFLDRIEVLGSLVPTSTFADQVTLSDSITVELGVVGTPITISLDDSFTLSDSMQTNRTEGIDDYYRRYLDDRVIAGGDILLWFSDEWELTDDIQSANS